MSMTKEDVMKHMLTKLTEEIEDAEGYFTMYKYASENGDEYDLAEGLMEIFKDEYSHAAYIKMKIEEMGGMIPADVHTKIHELDEHMESFPD